MKHSHLTLRSGLMAGALALGLLAPWMALPAQAADQAPATEATIAVPAETTGETVPSATAAAEVTTTAATEATTPAETLGETEPAATAATMPEDAQPVYTLEDALDPDRSITIYAQVEGGVMRQDAQVTLYAQLSGYDNLTYTTQWQINLGQGWQDLEDGQELSYTFQMNQELYRASWRIQVHITQGEIL